MVRISPAHGRSVVLSLALSGVSTHALADDGDTCTTISDGTLVSPMGEPLMLGFDEWGYNYTAHVFQGSYCDTKHDADWCQAFRKVDVMMKWNDAWLASRDCDGDGKLDRHAGSPSYVGSGASVTNLMHGIYEFEGQECSFLYSVTIEAVPTDAKLLDGLWVNKAQQRIGPSIWGEFAVVKQTLEDPCGKAQLPGIER